MTVSASHEAPYRALGETLRRELDAACARVEDLTARRREAEQQLRAARTAEDAARESLSALEAVARDAGEIVLSAPEGGGAAQDERERLAGAALRDMIARVALQQHSVGQPVHWREWHGWLHDAGYEAAGKKPEATFQTQLARSALVRRSPQDGVYVLDLSRFLEERDRLAELLGRLAALPSAHQLALLGDTRAERRALQKEIAGAERAIDEIWRVLAQERPPVWSDDAELVPEDTVAAWLGGDVGAARDGDGNGEAAG
jgi:hypothetical protein